MGSIKLTDTTVSALVCPAGKKDIMFFDATLKGFGLRVTAKGAKVFLYQYRAGAAVRRHRLGEWPTITVAKARKAAETHRGAVGGGGDPVAERKARHAAEAGEKALAKAAAAVDAFTLEKLIQEWETRALSQRRESYRKEATTRVRQGLKPWLDKPATKLARSDAASTLKVFARDRGPIGANRLMAYARACYGWGIKADLVTVNPFSDLAAPGRETARERALDQDEVRAVWAACEALANPQQAFIRFLLLTLQRRSEVAGAVWSEFSEDLSTWTIPAARAKNGRTHLVHLAPAAREVLAKLTRSTKQPLVFALPGGSQLTAFSVIKTTIVTGITTAETEAAAAAGREPKAMPPWTFHDFRRSGVTALAGQGFAPHVCDRLLNHVSGSIQGVAAVYQRAEFLTEREAALQAWAALITA